MASSRHINRWLNLDSGGFLGRVLLLKIVEVVDSLLDHFFAGKLRLQKILVLCLVEELENTFDVVRCARPGRNLLDDTWVWPPDELSFHLVFVKPSFLQKAK